MCTESERAFYALGLTIEATLCNVELIFELCKTPKYKSGSRFKGIRQDCAFGQLVAIPISPPKGAKAL